MTKNKYILLILLLLVGIPAAFLLFSQTTPGVSERDFRIGRDQDVVKIELAEKGNPPVVIERTSRGWMVNEKHEANNAAVDDLLATLRNLEVRYPVSLQETPRVIEDMESDGIKVDVFVNSWIIPLPGGRGLFAREKKIRSFMVGEDTVDDESTYMMMLPAEKPYVVHVPGLSAGLRETFIPDAGIWRDPVLVDLHPYQIQEVKVQWVNNPEESFTVRQQDTGFEIYPPDGSEKLNKEVVDEQRLLYFLRGFQSLYYERLLTDESIIEEHIGNTDPFIVIEIEAEQSSPVEMSFFRKPLSEENLLEPSGVDYDPDRFYIRFSQQQYAIGQYFVFNRIMRPLSFFAEHQP